MKNENWLEKESRLAPSEVKKLAMAVVEESFQRLDEILAEMKDNPKGKKAAVEIEFQLLPVVLKESLSEFINKIECRAKSGCIIIPTIIGKKIWDESWKAYLEDVAKMDEADARIRSSPAFVKFMNTPMA